MESRMSSLKSSLLQFSNSFTPMTTSIGDQGYYLCSVCVDLVTSLLVGLDYCLQIFILSYAYFYQFFLTFLYVLMAIFCLLIGAKSKLEKVNKKHQSDDQVKEVDTSYESNHQEESGYLTDTDHTEEASCHTSAASYDVYDEIDDNNNFVDENNNNAEVINEADVELLSEEDLILDKYFNLDIAGRLVFINEDNELEGTDNTVYHVGAIKDLVNKLDRLAHHGIEDDQDHGKYVDIDADNGTTDGIDNGTTDGIEADHSTTDGIDADHGTTDGIEADNGTENDHCTEEGTEGEGIEASVSDQELIQELQDQFNTDSNNNEEDAFNQIDEVKISDYDFDDSIECSADDKLDLFNVSNHEVD